MEKNTFLLGEDRLTVAICKQFLEGRMELKISPTTQKRIENAATRVADIVASGKTVYGINTGFGPLCSVRISAKDTRDLQTKILISHAVGVGKPIHDDLVRLMLLTKLHALSFGFSGIQLDTILRILFLLENDILPLVPEKGSVGASGDLAPLAHLFLPLIGEGEVQFKGEVLPAIEVLKKYTLQPLQLEAKEGLALINGTQFILAHALMSCIQGEAALRHADFIAAVQIDAMKGSVAPFRSELHALRPFPQNQKVAKRISAYLKDSKIPESHVHCDRVQDPYSLRCVPQVHGASWQAYKHLQELTEIELNAVTDNPVILENGESISGGNFHGQPLAMALDYLKLALAEVGNISDRRIYLSLEGEKVGLPKLLMRDTGLNSGFMILQYTTAALVSENKALCFPNSADSIPTSLGQEDHVSMGSISGRKCIEVLDNLYAILAIEAMVAFQGLELNRPLLSSSIIEENLKIFRQHIPFLEQDVYFAPLIRTAENIIRKNLLNLSI